MSFIFIYKIREKRMEQVLPAGEGGCTSERGKEMGKGLGKVHIIKILCTHVCKWKNDTSRNCSRNGGRRIEENDGGCEFEYHIFDIL
jgi:hypothetical protein